MKIERQRLFEDERRVFEVSPSGVLRVGVGYPNTYHVAMSSLAYQWVVELASLCEGVGVERFFASQPGDGRTFETGRHLGDLDVLAWSCSFELDAANLLATLSSAGIPARRSQRDHRHPLLVMGGAVASINPLPLSPAVDVFVLGAAERLWRPLLELSRDLRDRDHLLSELASRDGYFVPEHHLDEQGRPSARRRRVEKRDVHMADSAMVPASHIVTPHTEYSGRGLVEMSRGCPEKCRYCWVSYNYGRLRSYPRDGILDKVDRIAKISDRIGFVATAVGDHPDLAEILHECRRRGLNVALSSLRIPAMREEILRPLAESGARSVTIAPETGSDELRRKLKKPISNQTIVAAAETAQRCGIKNLKMYFIIGLPGETDDDLVGIVDLIRETRRVMVDQGRSTGSVGTLLAGFNVLVPKPYTPYSREAMLTQREARRRMKLIQQAVAGIGGVRIDHPGYREAQWQAYLSRGGVEVFDSLLNAASGASLGALLATNRSEIDSSTLLPVEGDPVWRFVTSAPVSG